MFRKVAVLLGGMSAESEVSVNSGENACRALDSLGVNYVKIDPANGLIEQLEKEQPDVVLNMLHGTFGEDGAVQGVLEVMGIPYTHSGVLASAVSMNKEFTKKMLADTQIQMAKSKKLKVVDIIEDMKRGVHPFPLPYIVKPLDQGSTVRVHKVTADSNPETLNDWQFGDYLMAEEYIEGIELTTGVLNGKALTTIEIEFASSTGIQEYDKKYTPGAAKHIFPPRIPEDQYELAQKWAEIVYNRLECRTTTRVDYIYSAGRPEGERLVFLENNTHPGFTRTSNIPDILKFAGMTNEEYISALLDGAKCDLNQRRQDVYSPGQVQEG